MSLSAMTNRLKKLEQRMRTPDDIPYLTPVEMAFSARIELDPWQCELVSSDALRVLVNCSRQSGKSLSAAIIAVWTALYVADATILLLSPSLRQSSELFKKCMQVFNALDNRLPVRNETVLRLELANGSRIVSLPGKEETVRSFSAVHTIILDESSRIPDELYYAVKPFLAVSNGRLLMLSTPNGKRGVFWNAYQDRKNWQYFEINATQCPRISEAFLESEKADIGDYWFLQEYMCQFQQNEQAAFRAEDIERIIDPNLESWDLFEDIPVKRSEPSYVLTPIAEQWDI